MRYIKKECISYGCWSDKIEKAFQLVEKDLDSVGSPTRKDQEEFMIEQIRFLFIKESELKTKREIIEKRLNKMKDEDALERARGGKR